MKGSNVKWAIIVALTTCLVLLVVFLAPNSVEDRMAIEREYPRKNMALSMRQGKSGIIYIEGEGKLYADDLNAMIAVSGIKISDIKNIIIGDNITEIGYNTFHNVRNLKTLKLGRGVTRIGPGVLKERSKLKWLYYPSDLKDIALDFLYESPDCSVVTPVQYEKLIPMENVQREKIYAGVDSLKELQSSVGEDVSLPKALAYWWK